MSYFEIYFTYWKFMKFYNIQSKIIIFGLKYFYLWTICVFFFLYEYDVIIRKFMFLINNFFIQYNSNCSPVYFPPVPHKNCSPVHFRISPRTNWSPVHFRPVPHTNCSPVHFRRVPHTNCSTVQFLCLFVVEIVVMVTVVDVFFSSIHFVFYMIDHRFRCVQFRDS